MRVWACAAAPLSRVSRRAWWPGLAGDRGLHASAASQGINKKPAGRLTFPDARQQVETSTAEWHYVERLFPHHTIPKPQAAPGEVMPSGWVAPSARPGDHPYFVNRNPSHMLPVYLQHEPILQRYMTKVNRIEGDIFALLEDLRAHLKQQRDPRLLNMRAHEPQQRIEIKGQYVAEVKEFLLQRGF